MLFIREYNAKSLDRSSVSMIDKYNARLDRVGQLLDNLSSLINNLLSLIRDIRNTLGQSKQRIYNNLDQVKEVIEGNGITGTEATIKTIEDALEAGDKAIDEAEATLEGVQAAVECSEEYCSYTSEGAACGEIIETCNENPATDEDCAYCSFTSVDNGPGGAVETQCSVCQHDECAVDVRCGEEMGSTDITDFSNSPTDGCVYSVATTYVPECNQSYTTTADGRCGEITCGLSDFNGTLPSDCPFSSNQPCGESQMPDGCTYTCVDGGGCSNGGDDCSYGTVCGQADSCNQIDCNQYDCGEPCGETCHMSDSGGSEGDCSEGSCGEDDGNDDGPCNQYDCSEYDCGEPCGESCGLDF